MELLKTYKRIYTITFLVILLLGLLTIRMKISLDLPTFSRTVSYSLQQLLVMLALIGLPGVLLWSSKKVKALKEIDSLEIRLGQYRNIMLKRLLVYSVLGVFAVFIQLFTTMKGIDMLFLIILVLFVFIWPSRSRFEAETGFGNKDQEE